MKLLTALLTLVLATIFGEIEPVIKASLEEVYQQFLSVVSN